MASAPARSAAVLHPGRRPVLHTGRHALRLAARERDDGAGGVVFGRNAIQVADPFRFQAALADVVKHGVAPEEAIRTHNLE